MDPDESIWANDHLDERHQATLEEFALDHAGEFDVALAVYVLEHVADPQAFTAACARTLRPGGLFFALTVHKYQYFGLTTWATTRLHINDWLLLHLKPEDVVADYHFPTEYRMNSPAQCSRHLRQNGFRAAEFRMYDKQDLYAWYLPELPQAACAGVVDPCLQAEQPLADGHPQLPRHALTGLGTSVGRARDLARASPGPYRDPSKPKTAGRSLLTG